MNSSLRGDSERMPTAVSESRSAQSARVAAQLEVEEIDLRAPQVAGLRVGQLVIARAQTERLEQPAVARADAQRRARQFVALIGPDRGLGHRRRGARQ